MSIAVIGFDHVYLTVSSLTHSEAFYDQVLERVLGFRKNRFELGGRPHLQYYNRHFGIVLRAADPGSVAPAANAPGLHHLCLRVESEADVAAVAERLIGAGIAASPACVYPDYAPDYHATFFSDPDGTRLEVTNFRQERRERMNQW